MIQPGSSRGHAPLPAPYRDYVLQARPWGSSSLEPTTYRPPLAWLYSGLILHAEARTCSARLSWLASAAPPPGACAGGADGGADGAASPCAPRCRRMSCAGVTWLGLGLGIGLVLGLRLGLGLGLA